MRHSPRVEFHVSRAARDRYRFDEDLFSWTGDVLFANVAASRRFASRMNEVRQADKYPERAINPGVLNAMGLIDELLHSLFRRYRQEKDPRVLSEALGWYEQRLGQERLESTLLEFCEQFPPVEVYQGKKTAQQWLKQSTDGDSHREIALEELTMLWLENANPAFRRFSELFEDRDLAQKTAYKQITAELKDFFGTRPGFGPGNLNLIDLLRAPALAAPESLEGQLAFMREEWKAVLGDMVRRILVALDIAKEEELAIWMRFNPPQERGQRHFGHQQSRGDSSAAAVPRYNLKEPEYERFSPDVDWMPRTVMIAKSAFVWLDQLSKQYAREIRRLDQVPDEELDILARRGFNALWLIGLWERSRASQRIKQLMGNAEAAASAYSLFDYRIADDLGGESAYLNLRERAMQRGIRLGSDMVPNHMGIDSRWVAEHPEYFLSLPHPPYPAYRFDGPNLSSDGRVEIKIEDHYYNKTDAAVVFLRRDRQSGDTRYVYHGNDGTSYPWNDTAQLNYLRADVREAVIQMILHVARLSPIIRFDAAMTLAKQHYQRLWFPAPGTGGAIPSRAEQGLTKPEFDAAMPHEFWREVVDRVAVEAPGTLLLAEAFWLLEGYFVRTLGMHRVYNSAFMNMLRDEENANYREVIKKTLEFDPEILKRYVNFMNNPDERTAVDQFGKGDKYFGVCTLMSTLPGLPMFGHGQVEGYAERYGMEYRKAYKDERPDPWLVARHERQIAPLLYRRPLFAEVENFHLYDFYADSGHVNEDVFAYSNQRGGERAVVVYNNSVRAAAGWIRMSCAYAEKLPDGGRQLRQRSVGEALAARNEHDLFFAARDAVTGHEHLYSSTDIAERGVRFELGGYQCNVLLDWREMRDDASQSLRQLHGELRGRGVASLSDALRDLQLTPAHRTLKALLDPALLPKFVQPMRSGETAAGAARNGHDAVANKKQVDQTPPESAVNAAKEIAPAAKTSKAAAEEKTAAVPQDVEQRLSSLLSSARDVLAGELAQLAGIAPSSEWKGTNEDALALFRREYAAAITLPRLEESFTTPWSSQACGALPSASDSAPATWSPVLAVLALRALGALSNPESPMHDAAALFDGLRLRQPLAEAFESAGLTGEDRWRAAARVRALLGGCGSHTSATPFGWLHDPDVAWLINVHEHQGTRYFNKELFECLLWWMSLPKLLTLAETPDRAAEEIRTFEERMQSRVKAAAKAGYNLASLFEESELGDNQSATGSPQAEKPTETFVEPESVPTSLRGS